MYDYFDDYRDFQQENEVTDLYELDDIEDDFRDEEDFVDFEPPYGCPHYRQFFPGGGFQPPRPPFGPPGGPQGGPQGGVPSGPPPSFTPSKSQAKIQGFGGPGGIGVQAVDPGAIRPCRFRFVYIWLRNGNSFWAWLTFVGRRSVSGYRWNGRRWVYFGVDTRRIESFVCY
jgi:hypothetical protein